MAVQKSFDNSLLNISLAAASLMFVLPFLNPRHLGPIPSFYAEWAAAAFLLIAGVNLLRKGIWFRPLIPKIALLPAGLIILALFQRVLGQGGLYESFVFFLLYLLGAAFAVVVGQSLRQSIGLPRLAVVLARSLLVGGLLSALVAILSKFTPHLLPSLIENNQGFGAVRGNLMQNNHLANYLWMSITAACILNVSRLLATRWLIAALAPMLLVAAMTSSRSSLVYLMGMNLLSFFWWYRARSVPARHLLKMTLLLVPGFLVAQGIAPLLSNSGDFVSPVSRITGEMSDFAALRGSSFADSSIKILESKIALLMFADKPWLGNGIGSYPWGSFVFSEQFDSSLSGEAEHAHNLPAHLLAELGIGSLLLLIAALMMWWRDFSAQKWAPAHVWMIFVLMIQAWHSLVEYPLWYTFFLLPTSLILGAASEEGYLVRMNHSLRTLRVAVVLLLLIGSMVLLNLRNDYLHLEHALYPELETGQKSKLAHSNGEIAQRLLTLGKGSLFAPQVGLIYAEMLEPTQDALSEKLIITKRAMHFLPHPQIVLKYALLLELSGRHDDAQQQLRWMMHSYPELLPMILSQLKLLMVTDPSLPFGSLLKSAEAESMRRLR